MKPRIISEPVNWPKLTISICLDESEAQTALTVLNQRVAAIFCQAPLPTTFVFVPVIDEHRFLNKTDGAVMVSQVLGDCDHARGTIRLIICKGWEATAIHELVHRYNPTRRHQWVNRATIAVAKLLKQAHWC